MQQANSRSQGLAYPLQGVIFVLLSIFLILSLVSYSPIDPSWNNSSPENHITQNWGGLVGSWISDALLQSLGLVAYLLSLGILALGLYRLREEKQELERKSKISLANLKLPAALILSCLCVAGLLSLPDWKIYTNLSAGGFIGYLLAHFGQLAFSSIGSAFIFVGGLWVAAVLVNERAGRLPKFRMPEFKRPNLSFKFSILKKTFEKTSAWVKNLVPSQKNLEELGFEKPTISQKLDSLFQKAQIKAKNEDSNEDVIETASAEDASSEARALKILSLPFKKEKKVESEDGRMLLKDESSLTPRKRTVSSQLKDYQFPSLALLDRSPDEHFQVSKDELIENSKALEQKLFDFGIQGQVTDIRPGPIITLYEFEPAPGVKVKNIMNLTDDLKMAMKSVSIRILAPIPGKAAVGIEIPNHRRQTVVLKDILQAPIFQNSRSALTMALGKTTGGEPYVGDLAKMPHLLMAGATGSGKSVGLNAMIISMLYKASPEELKFIMIDPKMLELSAYEGIPHLLLPVVTDPKKAARALQWAVKEMERRYKLISSLGARNLKSYNEKVEKLTREELEKEIQAAAEAEATTSALIEDEEENLESKNSAQQLALEEAGVDHYVKLPYICIVIDELADLIMVSARDVEESIARLAQMARAAGIHLILATQRPSVDVITGVIKANFPTRIAYQVASKVDSRTIIDGTGAENLIGDGDMLFLPPGTSRLERLHGPFISEDEMEKVVRHLKSQGVAEYNQSINLEEQSVADSGASDDIDDELYDQALQVVFETKSPSASMLQRRLRIGYNRAARLVEKMEAEGIVSAPMGGGKSRELLVSPSNDYS
ncbi:MAG: DNA translocase FtsK [Bdellovibrionota bacterium]